MIQSILVSLVVSLAVTYLLGEALMSSRKSARNRKDEAKLANLKKR